MTDVKIGVTTACRDDYGDFTFERKPVIDQASLEEDEVSPVLDYQTPTAQSKRFSGLKSRDDIGTCHEVELERDQSIRQSELIDVEDIVSADTNTVPGAPNF